VPMHRARARARTIARSQGRPTLGARRGNEVLFWYNKEDTAHGVVEASQIVSSDRQRAHRQQRRPQAGFGRRGERVPRVAETLLLNE